MSINGNLVDVVQSATILPKHRGADKVTNQTIAVSSVGGSNVTPKMAVYHLPASAVRNVQHLKQQNSCSSQGDPNIPTIYIFESSGRNQNVRNRFIVSQAVPTTKSFPVPQNSTISSHNGHAQAAEVVQQQTESPKPNDRKRKQPFEPITAPEEEQDEHSDSDISVSSDIMSVLEKRIKCADNLQDLTVMQKKPVLSDGREPVFIVNLYESQVGYTFTLYFPDDGILPPSHVIPYSEQYLLNCVDTGTIPSKLLNVFEKRFKTRLFGDANSLITEIRDYRFCGNGDKVPTVRQVVLKQSTESLHNDFNNLLLQGFHGRKKWKQFRKAQVGQKSSDGYRDSGDSNSDDEDTDEESEKQNRRLNDKLSYDQRLELEKQLVNSTAGPLCLDPSPRVGLIRNRTQFAKLKWNTKDFRKKFKAWSSRGSESKIRTNVEPESTTAALGTIGDKNKTGKWRNAIYSSPVGEEMRSLKGGRTDVEPFFDFVKAWRRKSQEEVPCLSLSYPESKIQDPPSNNPVYVEDLKKAGLFLIPEPATVRSFPFENSIKKIEEYTLETERRKRPHTTKLSIYQRNGIECYYGELEMESFGESTAKGNANKLEQLPSTKCQFDLGCSRSVALYVQQFTDIFTEDGRRPCKITYQKVGQPAQICVNSYKTPATAVVPQVLSPVASGNLPTPVTVASDMQPFSASSTAAPNVTVTATTSIAACAVPPILATSMSKVASGTNSQPSVPAPIAGKAARLPITATVPVSLNQTVTSGKPVSVPSTSNPVKHNNSSPSVSVVSSKGTSSTSTSTAIATSTSTSPQTTTAQRSVQVVLPQPRAVQQSSTAVSSASTVQVQIQPQHQQLSHIYAVSANPGAVSIPTSTNPAAANVNFNLNVNSAGIVSLTPQQVLTRPHILNVNLQQQNQQRVTIQQHNQRLTLQSAPTKLSGIQQQPQQRLTLQTQQQQNSIRIKQQPTLATLLLTGIHPGQGSKPITVAIQPQPQNILGTTQNNMNSSILTSSMDQTLTSPIMLAPGTANSGGAANQNSLSVNLNAISLDGQLIAVSSAPHGHIQAGTTYHVAHPGNSMTMGISNAGGTMNTVTPLSAMNFIRLANSNTQLHRQGSTVSLMNPPGIIISGSNVGAAPALANNNTSSSGLQQLTAAPKSTEHHPIDELSVPDLNALLGAGQQTQQGKNLDGLNLNLNLNVNLNLSGATPSDSTNVLYDNSNSTTATISHGKPIHAQQPLAIKTEPGAMDNTRTVVVKQEAVGSGHQHAMNVVGVDSFLNSLCESNRASELAPKLESFGSNPNVDTVNNSSSIGEGYVASSTGSAVAPTSSSGLTLSDLLGSPPIAVVSSSSPSSQSIGGSNVINPVSSSIASTTPRLSALLAGTPSADTVSVSPDGGISLVDSSSSVSSYGNLLDRLAASLQQPQTGNIARVAGSRLNPIATATPSVVLEHPVLAATLTQQGNIVVNTSGVSQSGGNQSHGVSLSRGSPYRQIAPAPAPGTAHPNQPHQLINLLGVGIVNSTTSPSAGGQAIRINPTPAASPTQKSGSNPNINLNLGGRS